MDKNDEISLNRIFVSFDEIYQRYMRFNTRFIEELKILIKEPISKEIEREFLKKQNIKEDNVLLKTIKNKRNLFLIASDEKKATDLIIKFSDGLKKFFEHDTVKKIADNAADYMFGVQHLLVSICVQIEFFIKSILQTSGVSQKILIEDERLKSFNEAHDTLKNIRNIIAHNDGLLDELFKSRVGVESCDKSSIGFCLEGIMHFEKYLKNSIVIILFVLKAYFNMSDVIDFYNKFDISKNIKIEEKDIEF